MKKIFLVLLTFLTCAILAGCGEKITPEIQDDLTQDEIIDFFEDIEIDDIIFDDFIVPTTIEYLDLYWESNCESLLIDEEEIFVFRDETDREVTLKVYTTYEEVYHEKVFNLFLPNDEFNELGNVEDYVDDHNFVLNYLTYKMNHEYNYKTETTGTTTGSVKIGWFNFDVGQDVNSTAYKYEDKIAYDIKSETTKSPTGYDIDVFQKALFTEEEIVLSHARAQITDVTPLKRMDNETYLTNYGVSQYCDFTGYNIGIDDITSSTYSQVNDSHSFTYSLTPGDCSINKTQQLTVFGKLEEVNITSISITIIVDNEFNIIEMNTTEVFDAQMEGYNSSLTQQLKTTFTKFNPEELPFETLGFDRYYNGLTN